jgi:hypothetical protein
MCTPGAGHPTPPFWSPMELLPTWIPPQTTAGERGATQMLGYAGCPPLPSPPCPQQDRTNLHKAEVWARAVADEVNEPRVLQPTADIHLTLEVLDQLRLLCWLEVVWEDHLRPRRHSY